MAGRPSKYKKDMPDQLIEMMAQGKLDVQIYAEWGISKQAFYKWLNEHEELKEAHEVGLAKCEAYYASAAQRALEDRDDKGFKYFIAIMNNKFGWEKGAPKEASTTNNIQIGNVNVLQQKSRADLLDYVKASLEKHGDILNVKVIDHQPESGDPE